MGIGNERGAEMNEYTVTEFEITILFLLWVIGIGLCIAGLTAYLRYGRPSRIGKPIDVRVTSMGASFGPLADELIKAEKAQLDANKAVIRQYPEIEIQLRKWAHEAEKGEKDTMRLDWLIENQKSVVRLEDSEGIDFGIATKGIIFFETLRDSPREAIDAAMMESAETMDFSIQGDHHHKITTIRRTNYNIRCTYFDGSEWVNPKNKPPGWYCWKVDNTAENSGYVFWMIGPYDNNHEAVDAALLKAK